MFIKKTKDSFGDYELELSWGQLEVISAALEKDHADPVADELFAELQWYMERIPGPGESEEDMKMRTGQATEMAAGEDDGSPLPMPPHEDADLEEPVEGETPFERLTGKPQDQANSAQGGPAGPPAGVDMEPEPGDMSPEALVADTAAPATPPPKTSMLVPPPTTTESKLKKKKGSNWPSRSLQESVNKTLVDGGLTFGTDFRWHNGLRVDPEMSDAVVTLLRESSDLWNVVYNMHAGSVTFGVKQTKYVPKVTAPVMEMLEAPPQE